MRTIRFRDGRPALPVGKILCLGQNYAKHVEEMRGRVPDEPMLFLKPPTALVAEGAPLRLPSFSTEIHHEVELVVVVGRPARDIAAERAREVVAGYAVGLDLTARDVQTRARRAGHPWAVAKGFDGAAPVSDATPAEAVGDPSDLAIELLVNGERRQAGRTSEMIFPVDVALAYASRIFTLEPGDLLFTGTPSGVGPVRAGDVLEASIERVGRARWEVAR